MPSINWSELFENRKSVRRQFGSIWRLPIAKRYHVVMFREARNPGAVLEIGAGDRRLRDKIGSKWPEALYKSFDIDASRFHDFYCLDDIEGSYDLICMFEVIEHLTPETAIDTLKKCFDVLSPNGKILITTPNTYYPPGYLRDATHVTPWCYDELGGIVMLSGFRPLKIYRLYQDSLPKKIAKRLIFYPLFRILNIDFCKQIMIVAAKE